MNNLYSYKAQIMSKNPTMNTYNHIKFSDECINDIIANQPRVPVTVNFQDNSIGTTTGYELDDDRVICSFDISVPNLDELGLFAVPSGLVKTNDISPEDENGVRTIQSMELTSISITTMPADMSLSKLEKE